MSPEPCCYWCGATENLKVMNGYGVPNPNLRECVDKKKCYKRIMGQTEPETARRLRIVGGTDYDEAEG